MTKQEDRVSQKQRVHSHLYFYFLVYLQRKIPRK